MRVSNSEVALAWSEGRAARNHGARGWPEGTFYTDGCKIWSYELQIGDTTDDNLKIVRDYTARGSYGFKSQTTSCHVGLLRHINGCETVVV